MFLSSPRLKGRIEVVQHLQGKIDDVDEMSRGPHRRDVSLIVELDHDVMGTVIEALVLVEERNAVPAQRVEVPEMGGAEVLRHGEGVAEEILAASYRVRPAVEELDARRL